MEKWVRTAVSNTENQLKNGAKEREDVIQASVQLLEAFTDVVHGLRVDVEEGKEEEEEFHRCWLKEQGELMFALL